MSVHGAHALVASAVAGDQQALLALLAAAQPDIRRYARRSCRASDVDDAVQETMWLLYRKVGSLRAVASLAGWLLVVVTRACMRLTGRAFGLGEPLETVENDQRFAQRSDHDLRIDLAQALQSLPEHYRAVVLLRDVEEMTIDEIGAALDLTRETVKARLHRARRLLREYLRD